MKTIIGQDGKTYRVQDEVINARAIPAQVPQGLDSPTNAMSNSTWASTFRDISPNTAKGAIVERVQAGESNPTRGIAASILTQLFGDNYAGAATPKATSGVPGTFGVGTADNFNGAWSGSRPQAASRFQPTVGGAPVFKTGAGFQTASGTSATPNADEGMDIRTNGAWSGWTPPQRRSYLQGQRTTGPVGAVVDSGVSSVFNPNTGFLNTQRTVGGPNGASTEIGPMSGAEKAATEWKYAPRDNLGNRMPVRGFASASVADKKKKYGWGG